jgi:hypothetical protein
MPDSVRLNTTWEIRHTDPIAPGEVVLRVLSGSTGTVNVLAFPRPIFLEFAAQIQQTADAIRAGTV